MIPRERDGFSVVELTLYFDEIILGYETGLCFRVQAPLDKIGREKEEYLLGILPIKGSFQNGYVIRVYECKDIDLPESAVEFYSDRPDIMMVYDYR